MTRVIVAALATLVAFAIPAAGAGADRAGAYAAVEKFHAALERGDAKVALALLDANVTVYEEGGAELSRDEYAAKHLPADIAFTQGTTETVTRRASGWLGNMAWIARQGHVTGRFRGKPVDRLTTETMVLQNTAQGWRIVHVHWSSRRAPAN